VQLTIEQVVVAAQSGKEPQVVTVFWLQFLPEHLAVVLDSVHLFWFEQVGSGGQSKVLLPCLVTLVMLQVSVF